MVLVDPQCARALDAVACTNERTREKDRDIQRRWKRAILFSFRTVTRRRCINVFRSSEDERRNASPIDTKGNGSKIPKWENNIIVLRKRTPLSMYIYQEMLTCNGKSIGVACRHACPLSKRYI